MKDEQTMTNDFSVLSFAIKNVKRRPLRTAMLVLAITLLTAVLVFALSFIYRVHASIQIMTSRLGADIIVVPTGSRGAAEDVLLENKVKSFYMDQDILEKVSKIDGIEKMTHQTYLVTLSSLCCSVPESLIIAFDQDSDFIMKPWLKGKIDRKLGKGESIVGHESSFNISVGLVEVDSVLFGNVFKMVGVLDKTGTGLDNAVFISDDNISDIVKNSDLPIKPGQVSIIFAKIKEGFSHRKVANAIEDSIIEVDAVTGKDIGRSIINTLRDISGIFSMTIALASILSIFLAWTVFSAVANERSQEVGIMRAVGAKESHVMGLFFIEVLLIGAVGSTAGIVFGTGLSVLLAKSFTILKNISSDLRAVERLAVAVIGFVAGTGICIIGALVPIRRIKKMEPLTAIKER
ncbi:MAG TPA: hypothetical protein DCO77_06865 [Nitrospiraceae bacterium]|nr:hypothetical protein [Nitrospiraceae bacterium]